MRLPYKFHSTLSRVLCFKVEHGTDTAKLTEKAGISDSHNNHHLDSWCTGEFVGVSEDSFQKYFLTFPGDIWVPTEQRQNSVHVHHGKANEFIGITHKGMVNPQVYSHIPGKSLGDMSSHTSRRPYSCQAFTFSTVLKERRGLVKSYGSH